MRDNLVKDIFSWNLNNKNQYIKEKLLNKNPTSIDKAIEIAKACELSRHQAKQLLQPETTSSSFVGRLHKQEDKSSQRKPPNNRQSQFQDNQPKTCGRCGQVHRFKCPAQGKECSKCKKLNHFAKMCKTKICIC